MASPRRPNGELKLWEKREIQAVSDYANQREEQLEKLADDFDQKDSFGLFWDSKVPQKDRSFFYFFTFRCTNKEEVIAEIEKYRQFYREMSELASKIAGDGSDENGEGTSQSNKDVKQLIRELRKQLAELSRAAEAGEQTTGSYAVYDLHREFVAKHQKLEHLIKNAECVAKQQSLQTFKERYRQSQQTIIQLTEQQEKSDDRFNQLCAKHEEVKECNVKLEGENDLLQKLHQLQSEKSDKQEKELEKLEQEKSELSQKNQESDDRHKDVCEKFHKLFAAHQEVSEDKEVLKRENNSLNEQLSLEKSENQENVETLKQKNEALSKEIRELRELVLSLRECDKNTTMILNLKKTAEERSS